jgi:pilus assembly protein Flp/PilA
MQFLKDGIYFFSTGLPSGEVNETVNMPSMRRWINGNKAAPINPCSNHTERRCTMNFLKDLYCQLIALRNNEKGQTLVEYALLLVLIAIVVIVMVTGLGQSACNTFSTVNSALQ